jgi:hypothetical protein
MRMNRLLMKYGWALLGAFLLVSTTASTRPQDEQRSTRVPMIGKVTGGTNRQAFSGKLQSVDKKRKLLVVHAVEGSYTEFFPIKKNFQVQVPGGKRMRLSEVEPGTNIIVYYEVKGDRRSVTDIMLLEAAPPDKKEEAPKPSSSS